MFDLICMINLVEQFHNKKKEMQSFCYEKVKMKLIINFIFDTSVETLIG